MSKMLFFLLMSVSLIACRDSARDGAEPSPLAEGTTNAVAPARLQMCYQGDAWICAIEAEIVARVNALRPGRPLTQHFESSFVARTWSSAQAAEGRLSHTGFPQQRQQVMATEFPGLRVQYRAENVAYSNVFGDDPIRTAEQLVALWERSAGHRTNMLGSYEFIGVGVYRREQLVYATQLFH